VKKLAFFLLTSAAALACSSDPESPAPGGAGQGGSQATAGTGGTASVGGSAAGSVSGGSTSAGAGGTTATGGGAGTTGGAGSGGTTTAGGGGGGNGGSGGAAGGSTGGGGSGGTTPVDPGNLPNMIPQGYTGTPFGGTPQTIPGKIEIEKYDLGGAGVAYQADVGGAFNKCGFTRNDALKLQCTQQQGSPEDLALPGCGKEPAGEIYLGYIGAGNWYKYTVNVTEAGTYVISGHEGVAGNTKMQFTFTDAVKTEPLTLPSTDMCGHEAYHVWATHDHLGEITLQPGKYVLQITSVAAAMNLDWFAFTKK
jgi:hypothetical protein